MNVFRRRSFFFHGDCFVKRNIVSSLRQIENANTNDEMIMKLSIERAQLIEFELRQWSE